MKTKPKVEVRKRFPNAFRTAMRILPHSYGKQTPLVHVIQYRTTLPGGGMHATSRLIEIGRGESSSEAWRNALSKIEAEEFAKALTA